MSNWGNILLEIGQAEIEAIRSSGGDKVRRKYLKEFSDFRQRNAIAYYSGWLAKGPLLNTEICDDDMNGLMQAVHGLDCSKGLDLILHTPGGEINATEAIIGYLRSKFGTNIDVFVPQLAMSGGTMIACSSKTVYMGKQSSLGPIDPQLKGMAAAKVIEEFNQAHKEISSDQSKLSTWQFILSKYHPTFLTECQNAIDLSKEVARKQLIEVMYAQEQDGTAKANKIVNYLTDAIARKSHGRHLGYQECLNIGLKVSLIEDDQKLQDSLMCVHHSYIHTLSNTPVYKIIENQNGNALMRMQGVQIQGR